MKSLEEYFAIAGGYMHADKPNIWPSVNDAVDTLNEWHRRIVLDGYNAISSGGFELRKVQDDSMVTWELTRHVVDFFEDKEPEYSCGFDWLNSANNDDV